MLYAVVLYHDEEILNCMATSPEPMVQYSLHYKLSMKITWMSFHKVLRELREQGRERLLQNLVVMNLHI